MMKINNNFFRPRMQHRKFVFYTGTFNEHGAVIKNTQFFFGFCNDPNSVLLRLLYIFPSFLHSYPVQGLMQNCSGFSLLYSFFRLGNASSDASRLLCEVLQSAVENFMQGILSIKYINIDYIRNKCNICICMCQYPALNRTVYQKKKGGLSIPAQL